MTSLDFYFIHPLVNLHTMLLFLQKKLQIYFYADMHNPYLVDVSIFCHPCCFTPNVPLCTRMLYTLTFLLDALHPLQQYEEAQFPAPKGDYPLDEDEEEGGDDDDSKPDDADDNGGGGGGGGDDKTKIAMMFYLGTV